MSNRLYVGNLSWNTSENGLFDAFSGFGEVREAKIIMDRETGRSRGFAFVSFTNAADAQAAANGMEGANLDGRSLRIREAEERPSGGGRRNAGGGSGRREDTRPSYRGDGVRPNGRPRGTYELPEMQVYHTRGPKA